MSHAYLVQGLGFGDEGKGATVDKICRDLPVSLIVRFNGGGQAAHNVVTPTGVHHTFSQFGSGMLANNTVRTHLSEHVLVNPISMMREAESLSTKTFDPWSRTTVHANAIVVTPFHRLLNQLRENARGNDRHGSCGVGIGIARETALNNEVVLRAGYVDGPRSLLRARLERDFSYLVPELKNYILTGKDPWTIFEETIENVLDKFRAWPATIVDHMTVPYEGDIVFEGAQGALLDETHGTAPHNTWTDCTYANAEKILDDSIFHGERVRVGCIRTYHTRHGAGPLYGESEQLTCSLPEPHNGYGPFQGGFRCGEFSYTLFKRGLEIMGGVHYLAVSHMDYLPILEYGENNFLHLVEQHAPVAITAYGPTAADRVWRSKGERWGT